MIRTARSDFARLLLEQTDLEHQDEVEQEAARAKAIAHHCAMQEPTFFQPHPVVEVSTQMVNDDHVCRAQMLRT